MKGKKTYSNSNIITLDYISKNKIIHFNKESNVSKDVKNITEEARKIKKKDNFIEVKIQIDKFNYNLLPKITKILLNNKIDKIILVFSEFKKNPSNLPSLEKSIPFIHKTIDYVLLMNKVVETENIPYCFMVAYKRYMRENNGKILSDKSKKKKSKIKTCAECKYNIMCDGLWNSYLKLYGQKGIKPITHKGLITDNERCMISILLKENSITTKYMLKLKASEEFKDICANCVGSDDVIITGNNLVEKSVIKKELTKNGFVWGLVDNYKSVLKEKGFI